MDMVLLAIALIAVAALVIAVVRRGRRWSRGRDSQSAFRRDEAKGYAGDFAQFTRDGAGGGGPY